MFHDSNLSVTLTDAMFNLHYVAASLGVDVEQGGISVKEEEVVATEGGIITASETPVAFDGSIIGWYKKPTEENWVIGNFTNKNIVVAGANAGDVFCLKYFYLNENARGITIKTQYIPSELHIVVINDLFNGDIASSADTSKVGRLITDIPRLQMDGNQDLSLTASGAANVSLTGSALAVVSTTTCEEDPYYGTMTEEIFGQVWQDEVIALAVADADIELTSGQTQTLGVYAVFGAGSASQLKANSNFTFAVEDGTSATVSTDGVVSTATGTGKTIIAVTLTGYPNVSPAYVQVTVE